MQTRFTWDEDKAARTLRERGISFLTAQEVFNDPNQIVLENYSFDEDREQRFVVIGLTQGLLLLMVVFVDRSEPEQEIIRIISARKANSYEEALYATSTKT